MRLRTSLPMVMMLLQRLRAIIVTVAYVDAVLQGRELDVERRSPVAKRQQGLLGNCRITAGFFERYLRPRTPLNERACALQRLLCLLTFGRGRGGIAPQLGDARLELVQACRSKCAGLVRKILVQGYQVRAPSDQCLDVVVELVDEAAQIVEPTPVCARIDDADELGPRLHFTTGCDSGQGPDLAFDRRAQRDQAGIDDGLGARRLQECAHRDPANRNDNEKTDKRF